MGYYFNKILKDKSFEEVINLVTDLLKVEGFGILTEIDVKATLKAKLDVDFEKYVILGACNPQLAHQALLAEDKIGVFLPCNVIVKEHENGDIEVAAVDPMSSMMAVTNKSLGDVAIKAQVKLKRVIQNL